jgi:hypothetical protein
MKVEDTRAWIRGLIIGLVLCHDKPNMSNTKKYLVLLSFFLYLFFQTYSIITFKNMWPISALTMYANTNSKHFKIRAVLQAVDGKIQKVPYDYFYPFGKYRSMSVVSHTLVKYMNNKDAKSEFILTDIAKRAEDICKSKNRISERNFKKMIYQYCQNCNAERQDKDWSSVYEVKINC